VLERLHEPYILLGVCTLKWILALERGNYVSKTPHFIANHPWKLVVKEEGSFENVGSKGQDQICLLKN